MSTSVGEAITIREVVKDYVSGHERVRALEQVSLTIHDNEFFTLLGPSGCGKTTLLRLIAGFEELTDGEIHLFGQHIEHLTPNQRPVNTVFQHYALFPHMTVAQNIAFGLERQKLPEAEVRERVAEMLRLVKMTEYANRRPANLSGGQQQRVALARALAPHPKVLLLDEPLSALDLKLRLAMREELKLLQQNTGITFIFVTHDQEEALSMSDRVAVMSQGRVQQIGSPSEIYEQPCNGFVADFIGEANLIPVECLEVTEGTVRCRLPSGREVSAVADAEARPGSPVKLFVRPERITLTPASGDGDGVVASLTYLGDAFIYTIREADGNTIRVNTRAGAGAEFQSGTAVDLQFDTGALRVLSQ